jgi:ElaB/YqjD/DUF883 family membrane-anchored ribosome-binding protein
MGTRAEELSTTPEDIAATRERLTRDVDELSDKVSPHRVIERRKAAAQGRISSLRARVMGTASSARQEVRGSAGSVGEAGQSAVDTVERRVEGNPLAAGLVAFGAGMVISALLPASDKEAQAAGRLVDAAKEHGQPLVDEARSVAQDVGSDLKESAQEAAQELKDSAKESAQHVRDEGAESARSVKGEAQGQVSR